MPDITDNILREVSTLQSSMIRSFDREVSSIDGILKLTLGEPDFDTPAQITQAACKSLAEGHTHYAPNAGTEGLRKAITRYLKRRRDLVYSPRQIIVTLGASEALSSILGGLLDSDTTLLYPEPAFNLYRTMAILSNAEPYPIDTSHSDFKITPETLDNALLDVRRRGRKPIVTINYPNNPTGVALNSAELRKLSEVIKEHDALVISDEVYAEIHFGEPSNDICTADSIARYIPDRTILVDSTSKTFAMTGWRVGYFAAPEPLAALLGKVHQARVSTAATFCQDAAEEGYLHCDKNIEGMVQAYRERRDYLFNALTDLKFDIASPDGAFYLYTRIPDSFTGSGIDFARTLARQAKVAAIPGEAFVSGPSRHIRFSYAASMSELHEAVRRISRWLHQ
ncbi:pyridoxal phosphate-dependent aminotransferase [Bifidobacterium ruminantium]|uniref:Aminotransferase n=1 Tax=Bifidobacterium ruminantium TaxID=78346 RepID=A0A087D1V6_BIFRU|nr:aminotransferase class I/II-fold pyridoxal phosphate-dependent enzyme [Bifidobacterium ruminantium]KFI89506.1 aspartate/tyrosine/aromatic aminotransferase [Bifidobacterium ruminantium]